jgi:predicted transcriptional regulator
MTFRNSVEGMSDLVKLIDRVDALTKKMNAYDNAANSNVKSGQKLAQQYTGQSKAARRAQLGAQQLGMQLNDLSTSITTGANPMIAFNQQLGQIGFAMSQMQGKAQKLGMFLGGTWGAVLGLAAMGLYQLWQQGRKVEDTMGDLEKAISSGTEAIDFQKLSVNELAAANDMLAERNEEVERTARGAARATRDAAKANLANARALLASAEAEFKAGQDFQNLGEGAGGVSMAIAGPGLAAGSFQLGRQEEMAKARRETFDQLTESLAKAETRYYALTSSMTENARRADDLRQAINDLINSGQSGEAVNAQIDSLNKEIRELEQSTRSATRATRAQREEMSEMEKLAARLNGRYGDQADELQNVVSLYHQGAISARVFRRAVEDINKKNAGPKMELSVFDNVGALDLLPDKIMPIRDGISDLEIAFRRFGQTGQTIGNQISNAFQGMLSGAQSWKSAMSSLISTVIAELWRLYVVQKIVGFITSAIGSAGLPAPVALATTALNLAAGSSTPSFGGPRAMGGPVTGGKAYLVGERGPEIMVPGASGSIISNDNMPTGGGITVNVDARGATNPEEVKQQARLAVLEAAPAIIGAAQQRTISASRRRALPGGAI